MPAADYASYSDAELTRMFRSGDDHAGDEILRRYTGLARRYAAKYYAFGQETDDFFQEGMVGLLKAIESYDASHNTPFSAYAALCISTRLISAHRRSNTARKSVLDGWLSLDSAANTPDLSQSDPIDALADADYLRSRLDKLTSILSAFENEVLSHWAGYRSAKEVADILDCPQKRVENAITRIRVKAKTLDTEP